MKQQTAIDFLFQMYNLQDGVLYGEDFEEAERIFKHQIVDACNIGIDLESHLMINSGEEYYNQTFNQ